MKYRTGKTIENAELRSIQLEILQSVHHFCELNGLKYSLAYGTLLGAVRHQGYIPWDDDLDIMMPRPDYAVFMREFNGYATNYETLDYTNRYYPFMFGKVIDKRTVLVEALTTISVYIDVFPIDGMPQQEILHDYLVGLHPYNINISKTRLLNKENTSWLTRLKRWLKVKTIYPNRDKCISEYEKAICENYSFDTSQYAGFLGLETAYPRDMFLQQTKMLFEGREYNTISDYDLFLSKRYGDYMVIPPENERITHQFIAYWK